MKRLPTHARKRILVGGTAAVAVFLTVASTAYACTLFHGRAQLSGNGTGSTTQSVIGDPISNGAYQWCGTYAAFGSGSTSAEKDADWTVRVDDLSPSVTLTTSSVDGGCAEGDGAEWSPNQLSSGTYYVGVSNGYWDESAQGYASGEEDNCHSLLGGNAGNTGYGDIIDNPTISGQGFSIDSSGAGSKTYSGTTLNNAVSQGWNTICVFKDSQIEFAPANALNFKSI